MDHWRPVSRWQFLHFEGLLYCQNPAPNQGREDEDTLSFARPPCLDLITRSMSRFQTSALVRQRYSVDATSETGNLRGGREQTVQSAAAATSILLKNGRRVLKRRLREGKKIKKLKNCSSWPSTVAAVFSVEVDREGGLACLCAQKPVHRADGRRCRHWSGRRKPPFGRFRVRICRQPEHGLERLNNKTVIIGTDRGPRRGFPPTRNPVRRHWRFREAQVV
ncbi:hypothetical protein SCHPADRAFT_233320 [Schizopora paradoxa]|uniref:Uncharacterized protein n=1 Tax=Schizopora paradoxa TaxID=27342 RepID=A0A0H2RW48_9AGAM|nr:hypothetical protein SCHPADRAFT_233320 [Schizopora paradoxa]